MAYFADRDDAAKRLLTMLPPGIGADWLILGLPRGGVPIAAAIARHLGATLDVLIVRKVGVPGNPEVALAAVTGADPEDFIIDAPVLAALGLDEAAARRMARGAVIEVLRRRRAWADARPRQPIAGRDVLIVDDGVATGTTLSAAVSAARRQGARRIAIAVPVALGDTLARYRNADFTVVCPYPDAPLHAVGQAYERFDQVSDDAVCALLLDQAEPTPGRGKGRRGPADDAPPAAPDSAG